MKTNITYRQKYGPAMEMTDQAVADSYFEEMVQHNLKLRRKKGEAPIRMEAERVERHNLGYYAGYYDGETRGRVERLFKCSHPIFGSMAEKGQPTSTEALAAV